MSRLDVGFPAFAIDDVGEAWGHDLAAVADEFPAPDDPRWLVFRGEHEPLKRQGGLDMWGPATIKLILDLLSPSMCQTVAHLLGYRALIGDTYGGGYHLSGPGARLDVHRDFARHPATRWRRRANGLLFLNEGWQEEWGGVLQLGHEGVRVVPEMGRFVLFECGPESWHGHPEPITDGHWRKSLAVYYFDPLDEVDDSADHDTLWADG